MSRVGWVALALLVVGCGALWLGQRLLIYFPDRATPPPAAQVLPAAADVRLHTSDGLWLGAWLVRPPADVDRRVAVLVVPGNAGNRHGRAPMAAALARAGLTVMLLDYRGYGGNPGRPSQAGLALDARAGLTYLVTEAGFPPDRIVYCGESLGAAVATGLALAHPSAGLVLRSPFASLVAVGRHHYPVLPVGLLLRDRFPVADLVSRVHTPTIVVYGTADSVVPPDQSRLVAGRAANLVDVIAIEGADHNDEAMFAGPEVVGAVVRLADLAGGAEASR